MFLKCPSVSELCGILAKIQIPANLLLGEYKLEHAFCVMAALCGLRDISSWIRNGTSALGSEKRGVLTAEPPGKSPKDNGLLDCRRCFHM